MKFTILNIKTLNTMKQYRLFLILFISALLMNSCQHSKEQLMIIPEDAVLVFSLDGKSLYNKGKLGEIAALDMYKDFLDMMEDENDDMAKLFDQAIKDYKLTGIDFESDMNFFLVQESRNEQYMGLSMALRNNKKFKGFMEEFFDEMNVEYKLEDENEYEFFEFEDEESMLIATDGDYCLFLSTMNYGNVDDLADYLADLMSNKKAKSVIRHKEFREFYSNRKDINVWLATEDLQDFGYKPYGRMFNMFDLDDHFFSLFIEFNDDNILATFNADLNEDMMELFDEFDVWKDGVDKELLAYLPQKSFMSGSMAIKPDQLKEAIEDQLEMYGISFGDDIKYDMTLEELIDCFDGDVLFSLNDFVEYENDVFPLVSVCVKLKDNEIFDFIVKDMGEIAIDRGDYYEVTEDDIPYYFGLFDNIVVGTSDLNIIKDAREGGMKDNLSNSINKDLFTKNPMAFYFNTDMDNYPKHAVAFIEDEMNEENYLMLKELSKVITSIQFRVMEDNKSEFEFSVKEGKDNSFYALIDAMNEIYLRFN